MRYYDESVNYTDYWSCEDLDKSRLPMRDVGNSRAEKIHLKRKEAGKIIVVVREV